MTTDTVPKSRAARVSSGGRRYTVGGAAKGFGHGAPGHGDGAVLLTTDAPVAAEWLRATLRRTADDSLNMVDVDMDTSTSDTMLLFANGAAGGSLIERGHPAEEPLRRAIEAVAIELATRSRARR